MRTRTLLVVAAGIVGLLAAACGGDTTPPQERSTTAAPTAGPTATVQPTQEAAEADPAQIRPVAIEEPTPGSAAATATVTSETPTFAWQDEEDIDVGIKPAIALTSDDTVYVAYMSEDAHGFVRNAAKDGDSWQTTTISEGYFYGPLDLAIGPDDAAHIVYHDHQALEFQPDKGDAAYAVLSRAEEWALEAAEDDGHDGWDNRVTTDSEGNPHMSALDPKSFGGNGVEYYRRSSDGKWTVEEVGTGPLTYTFATSIALDPQGVPHITYHDQERGDLVLASRNASGWALNSVDTEGETGLFSDLVIDTDGRFHISYFQKTSDSSGVVKYASRGPSQTDWAITTVDVLEKLSFGFGGARNVTSLVLDSGGRPWIAYGDEKNVKLAIWNGSGWDIQTVVDAGFQRTLGQLVSLALDSNDRPHIAYFQVTNKLPLQGRVKYVTGTPR